MAFYQEIHSCTIPKGKEHLLGNHVCNRRPDKLNTVNCGWDAGDCKKSEQFPDCQIEYPDWIGNGSCDGGEYNTKECGWDGGDCNLFNNLTNCNVDDPLRIGNGRCDDRDGYNTADCGWWDGGDCDLF